ncbi:hypothetical protein A4A49_59495 [Nicotiana attenuata]|uniref:Uncharacterized protein n=1 Tax=Nicotiana attenuata TaxID=49451 RepID=A0A1J6JMS3_NICAT|nr:hypothetical protein A4A49_59495 [Nicotiana attenuata]
MVSNSDTGLLFTLSVLIVELGKSVPANISLIAVEIISHYSIFDSKIPMRTSRSHTVIPGSSANAFEYTAPNANAVHNSSHFLFPAGIDQIKFGIKNKCSSIAT